VRINDATISYLFCIIYNRRVFHENHALPGAFGKAVASYLYARPKPCAFSLPYWELNATACSPHTNNSNQAVEMAGKEKESPYELLAKAQTEGRNTCQVLGNCDIPVCFRKRRGHSKFRKMLILLGSLT